MTKRAKRLERMRLNPRNWRIEDLVVVAQEHGFGVVGGKGSHIAFTSPSGQHLTIPAHKPVKEIYVKRLVNLIEERDQR